MNLDRKTRIALLASILVVLLAATYGLTYLLFSHKPDIPLLVKKIDSIVSADLAAAKVTAPDMYKNYVSKKNGKIDWEQIELVVTMDDVNAIAILKRNLNADLNFPNLTLSEQHKDGGDYRVSVYLGSIPIYQLLVRYQPPPPPPMEVITEIPEEEPVPVERFEAKRPGETRPRIALIVDDAGYDLERAMALFDLNRPLTISVLPHLKYSRQIAELAHSKGYEVMLHLPMDSGKQWPRSPGFVTVDMTEKELGWVIDRDFQSIPYAIGVNNHQGSLMTADTEAMRRVMRCLTGKNVFFIDSRTTKDTVAYNIAKNCGVPAAHNNMFLDNEKYPEYIKERIELLMQEVMQTGTAIGICHVHPATTEALAEMLPVLEERGIDLVFVSKLVD